MKKPSYGELADETAQKLLSDVQATDLTEERQKAIFYLINESLDYVKTRFGETSIEYAWELVKVLSVFKAFGCSVDEKVKKSIRSIINVYYGENETERILKSDNLRDIFYL